MNIIDATIAQVLKLHTEEAMQATLFQLDEQYEEALMPLTQALARNVFSMDPQTLEAHSGLVESWRDRVARFLMIVSALREHAKSDRFELPREKGITETKREMHQRTLAGGYEAWKVRLENILKAIDSRVNLCKKLLGIESDATSSYRRIA
jgi:hypothetical protein